MKQKSVVKLYRIGKAKVLFSIILLLSISMNLFSQETLPGGFKHIIEVARFPNWGKGYLTITDPAWVKISQDKQTWKKEYITHEYVEECRDDIDKHLYRGCLIIEVDGVSAKGWTEEKFYNKVDGRKDVITLKIRERHFPDGIREFVTKIRRKDTVNEQLIIFGNAVSSTKHITFAGKRHLKLGPIYEERSDPDYDFFYCMFYDYKQSGDDPLLDKELIKEMGMLERNEDHPDVFLTVKKSASTKEQSEYMAAQYRRENGYLVKNKAEYNRTVTSIDTYLEIMAMDAKKMNKGENGNQPIVWTAIAKRNVYNGNYNTTKELKAYASWMTMPIYDKHVNIDEELYAPIGVVCTNDDKFTVKSVLPGSRAENLGIQPGDVILDAVPQELSKNYNLIGLGLTSKKQFKLFKNTVNEAIKSNKTLYRGWEVLDSYPDVNYDIEIRRNGNKIKMTINPVSINYQREYCLPKAEWFIH